MPIVQPSREQDISFSAAGIAFLCIAFRHYATDMCLTAECCLTAEIGAADVLSGFSPPEAGDECTRFVSRPRTYTFR